MKHLAGLLWAAVAAMLLLVAVPVARGQTYTSVMDALNNLKSTQKLDAFVSMVAAAGMTDVLSNADLQAYVFAATDDAMLADSFRSHYDTTSASDATKLVNYHVVLVASSAAAPPPLAWAKATLATLLPADPSYTNNITISPSTQQNKVVISSVGSGSSIDVSTSIVAGKSRIYFLTDVPLIIPSADTATTLVPYDYLSQHASQDASPFTIADFMLLVNTSVEVSELLKSATFAATIFIPSDDAFKAAWGGFKPPIGEIAGTDAATALLMQHIVPQPINLTNVASVKCGVEKLPSYTWSLKNVAGDDLTVDLSCPDGTLTVTTQTSKGTTQASVPGGSYIGGMSTFAPIDNVLLPGVEINFPPGLAIDNFIPPPPPSRPSVPTPQQPSFPPPPPAVEPSPQSPQPSPSPVVLPPPSPVVLPSPSPSPVIIAASPPPSPAALPSPSPLVLPSPPPSPAVIPSPSPVIIPDTAAPPPSPSGFTIPADRTAPSPTTRSGTNVQIAPPPPAPAPGAATRAAVSTPLMVLSALLGALLMMTMAAGTART